MKQINVFSQNGEDGLLLSILKRLNLPESRQKFCVEFGAWDGLHFSNTANLILNYSYDGLYIESNKDRFFALKRNFPQTNVKKINAFVGLDKENNLEKYLTTSDVPIDFDLLSIDIDGCDYYILETMTYYKPKIICIEYNPMIPQNVEFVQEKKFSVNQGASSKSIIRLAEQKGYQFVVNTETNLIFVEKNIANQIFEQNFELSFNGEFIEFREPCYIFSGYDGSLHLSKNLELPWHEIQVSSNFLQVLPKFLQHFPDRYDYLRKLLFSFYLRIKKIKKLS